MSEEREYIVIVNKGENLQEIEEEIKALTGDDFIPNRAVEVADERIASNRMTHFYLTDEEAEILRNDPRILDVEIPAKHNDRLEIVLNAYQDSNFYRGYTSDNSAVNWGLRRHIEETNIYGISRSSPSGFYEYAVDGTGVDVVIMDSGVVVDHPEFLDENGVSRVQQIDWYQEAGISGTLGPMFYTDEYGHGTHVAGISTGKTYGWAKGAHIYSMKIFDTDRIEDENGRADAGKALDLIKLWHQNKTNGRPTVVNMSWGYTGFGIGRPDKDFEDKLSGVYRDQEWSFVEDLGSDIDRLESEKGYLFRSNGAFYVIPRRVAEIDVLIDEMIDAGIHIGISAGNMGFKIDKPDGVDYNNNISYTPYGKYYYHRGASPNSDRALLVGAIDSSTIYDTDKITSFSERGAGVDIYAAGDDIMSGWIKDSWRAIDYPDDGNYGIASVSGTSMAAPQVVGVIAQHLQVHPNITPEQMKVRLINDSKPVIHDEGDDESHTNENSLVGSENRMLYSRYGKQPYKVNGSLTYRK